MANRRNMGSVNSFYWSKDNMNGVDMFEGPNFQGDFRNKRYNDAYGDYKGGYTSQAQPDFGFGPGPNSFYRLPPLMMGSGFGPGGPSGPPSKRFVVDDPAVKYLMRCGVPKENLRNLPKELLQLFTPEFCSLCAEGFDSFLSSRLHYVSKFHMKSQRRWLSQYGDKGNKMAPLKSRDRYCELCDVDITSVQHAESHYSGKPHRAIVEKRRAPKNPVLRQRHMEDRLAQLLRREKKYLKAIKENEATTEPKASMAAPEKGQVPEELYCDICKTSVTSTEQMTLHLNGKRHLTKEKQHILKMMRGEEVQKDPVATEKTATADLENKDDKEAENNDGHQEEKNNVDDDFDWGNGSGVWDEDD